MTEAREELSVELEGFSEPVGKGDDDLAVWNLLDNLVADEFAESLDLLLMAAGTGVALLAAEGDQVVVPAMQPGESTAQVTAGLEGVERLGDFQAEAVFSFLKPGAVLLVKRLSMGRQALPKRHRSRAVRVV